MNALKDEEDFWNSNEKNHFSFEINENVETNAPSSSTSNSYLTNDESQWKSFKPLNAIIPERQLHLIFERDKIYKQSEAIPSENPEKTLLKMIYNTPYTLEHYKSLKSKTALLDQSIESGDGNAILCVILFLMKTLKKSLLLSILKDRPVANDIYLHYLNTRSLTSEIVDLLKLQGKTFDAAMMNLNIIIKNTSNPEKLLQKLNHCHKTLFTSLPDCRETQYLQSYVQLLEWQMVIKESDFSEQFHPNCSLLECLKHSCRDYWDSPEGHFLSPLSLYKKYQISPKQYQKVAISMRSSVQQWKDIDNLLFTKNWVGSKKLQSSLSIEEIINILQKNKAPTNVLEQYLGYVDGMKKKLELAISLECHKSVIDILGNQGDRQQLMEYRKRLQGTGEHELYAENVLKSPAIKWKN